MQKINRQTQLVQGKLDRLAELKIEHFMQAGEYPASPLNLYGSSPNKWLE